MTPLLSPYRNAPLCPAHAAEVDPPTCPGCARSWLPVRPRAAQGASLLYDRRLRRTFVTGLFAATAFGAVIGTAIGFVAGASPLWAAPAGYRMREARHVAAVPVPVVAPAPPKVPPSIRPDAEPAAAPVSALTPLLAGIGPRAVDAEALVGRVEALARAGVPMPIEQRRLPRDMADRIDTSLAGARTVPRYDNGHVVGVQVFGVQREGLLGRAGLSSGDVVLALNGKSLDDLPLTLEELSFDRRIVVLEVARRGEPRVIVVRW